MDQVPQYHPCYSEDICRVCEEPLHLDDTTLGRVMHPKCEREWLDLKPYIPCKLCENPLDEDDVTNRRTVHLHCEAGLLKPPPNWPLQEADRRELELKLANTGTSCGHCGEPLSPDELALNNTMHESCVTMTVTAEERMRAEDEGNPLAACMSCGGTVEEDELVDDGSGPYHRRCLDINKQLDEIHKEGEESRSEDL